MLKNHISLLQEYMTSKRKSLPDYVTITERNGIDPNNSFTIRVTCDNLTADGQGTSKKEAKLNAAMKMCARLKLDLPSIQLSPYKSNTISINNSPLPTSPSSAVDSNYIGKLQEFAAVRGAAEPKYICGDSTGPPHNQIFTMTCRYNGFEETAKASTKKEAKRLVAKKMFDRVSVASEINLSGMQQLKIYDDNVISMQTSTKKAEKLYPNLRATTNVRSSTADKPIVKDYHSFLRDSFETDIRKIIVDRLQDIINVCEKYISSNCNFTQTHPLTMLKVTMEILNIDVQEIKYDINMQGCIHGLQLNTVPVISEIGCGSSVKEAEVSAILQMAKTVSIMLL